MIEEQLLNHGVLGIILLWFMWRMEKTINNNTKAINDLTRYILQNG